MLFQRYSGEQEGFSLEIKGGIIGTFFIKGAIREEYEDMGGYLPVHSVYGESEPILRNGEYFLPWHVTAALTANGDWENCWLNGKNEAEIISALLKIRQIYVDSGDWFDAVRYANQLTGEYVY